MMSVSIGKHSLHKHTTYYVTVSVIHKMSLIISPLFHLFGTVTTVQLRSLTFIVAAQNVHMNSVLVVVKKFGREAFLPEMKLHINTGTEVTIIFMVETLYQNLIFMNQLRLSLSHHFSGKPIMMEVLLVLQEKWVVVVIADWSLNESFQWDGYQIWKQREGKC